MQDKNWNVVTNIDGFHHFIFIVAILQIVVVISNQINVVLMLRFSLQRCRSTSHRPVSTTPQRFQRNCLTLRDQRLPSCCHMQ